MTTDANAMLLEIESLKAENASLKAKRFHKLTCKVGAKGGVSVYGLGRFPVSLYKQQWERLLSAATDISAFIKANDALLTTKD